MIDKIKGLSIKGRCFTENTLFKFFQNTNDRISIVYGKNGSGKSTISEGFSCAVQETSPGDLSINLIDEQGQPVYLSGQSSIFVFSEKYTDENVRIDDDGLGTIVLLGGQVDLQAEIDKYTTSKEVAETAFKKAQSDFEQFNQVKNPICPDYHLSRIKTTLQTGWAVKDSKIRNNKISSKVTENIIKEICALSVSETAVQLQKKFDDIQSLLEKTADTSISYPESIPQIVYMDDIEETLCNLLKKVVEKPILSEREQLIFSTIQNGKLSFVQSIHRCFSNEDVRVCPYCLRPIEDDYKHQLIESIDKVINKDVDNHRAALQTIRFPLLDIDYTKFSALDTGLVEKISSQAKVCSALIERYNKAIQDKCENIYTPLSLKPLGLGAQIIKLNMLLAQLETKRAEFNDAARRRKSLSQELILINKQLAHLQVEVTYKDYQKQMQARHKSESTLKTKGNELYAISEHLKKLEQRKSDVGLAIGNINNALDYVFFSKGRLSIELLNDKYYLKSNGKNVKPKDVSVGERNIIALCYFFTQILANQDISNLYKDEKLIVIDDPISSFDIENKVGIISLLRYQVNRIINGNQNSKILILSHDLAAVFDLRKGMEEICQLTKGNAKIAPTSCITLELLKQKLQLFPKTRNEYGMLLLMVYQFACNKFTDNNIVIGNAMRRVLEAFSTFVYQKNIEKVSIDKNVIAALGDHSIYFENLMYRLVLHGESHYEEQVYSLHDDTNFYQFISEDEKRRTAKDILCFMYCLNPYHINAYLQGESHAVEDIKQWVKAIPNNQSFEIAPSPKHPERRTIKLYNLPLSAGTGSIVFDDSVSHEDYETDRQNCDFALRVSGNSMEPDIPDGSIVLIKRCDKVDDGKIGAFYLNGEVFCKEIRYRDDAVLLISTNKDYTEITVSEYDTVQTYGEVVEVLFQ